MTSRASANSGASVVLFLAWLPLAIMLPVAVSRMTAQPLDGIWFGVKSALVGAALVALVWWFTGRVGWPRRASLRFYLTHLLAAVVFALAWRAAALLAAGVGTPGGPIGSLRRDFAAQWMAWDLMFKFAVYGLMAALSYTVRESDTARQDRERAAALDALATRAQLAALRSQLNPHFLFNTLHSLSVLIPREPARAEEAVDRLGALLRFTLRHGDDDEIPFEDEYRFVEHYLALEQLRLDRRLAIVADIDPQALGVRVPPFCLQPLVENAIRHGLSPRAAGGTLWIDAVVRDGALRVKVRDNGVGAAPNGAHTGGSGLGSLRRRLEARLARGELSIATAPDVGFSVTLHLPLAAPVGP